MDEISANLKYMASNNQRQVALNYKISETGILVSDKGRINILLNNLISNAIRYQNPEVLNPIVDVEINMSDTSTGIIVKDNGIGIDKENQIKIFDMFFRVAENSVGSGLGLYLVKEIVDKLEGKINLDSEIGVGTKFSVVIPNSYKQLN